MPVRAQIVNGIAVVRPTTVEGDPLDDITAISKRENVRWVMKAGQTVVDKTKRTGVN